MARGYLNRVELTGQRFFENPHIPGEILYKSGDLGRRLPDRNVEYLGRNDDQVQIRGFRIEPAEIESHLFSHPAVKETVVLAREDQNHQASLCAYICLVPGEPLPPIPQIREYLAARLPHYMVPSYFVLVNTIPLTPNGKVDKKALPAPQVIRERPNRIPPCTYMEETLAEIWAKVLRMKKEVISIDDAFFDSGGHSLKATVLIARIHLGMMVNTLPLRNYFSADKTFSEFLQEVKQKTLEAYENQEYPFEELVDYLPVHRDASRGDITGE
ncbi:MAG: AMP-binding protein [Candidatus Aminicenantes bacterium]|nr:MAG: AMP-binding protein [Candidatus Aminicenantes bacterium]